MTHDADAHRPERGPTDGQRPSDQPVDTVAETREQQAAPSTSAAARGKQVAGEQTQRTEEARPAFWGGGSTQLDDWLAIEPDGMVVAYSGKVELGTGVRTALAQIVAEELD